MKGLGLTGLGARASAICLGLAFLVGCGSHPNYQGYELRPTQAVLNEDEGRVLDVLTVWWLPKVDATRTLDRALHDYALDTRTEDGGIRADAGRPFGREGVLIRDAVAYDDLLTEARLNQWPIIAGQQITLQTWKGREISLVSFDEHDFTPGDTLTVRQVNPYFVLFPH